MCFQSKAVSTAPISKKKKKKKRGEFGFAETLDFGIKQSSRIDIYELWGKFVKWFFN